MGRVIAVARLGGGVEWPLKRRRWWRRAVGRGPVRSGMSRRCSRSAFEIRGCERCEGVVVSGSFVDLVDLRR